MQAIKKIINRKKIQQKTVLDDKTVFYVFRKVIKEEFGNLGENKFIPNYFSNQKLFIKVESSAWASELWLNKEKIIRKINSLIGEKAVSEIKVKA
jgi:hypothetical protein